jgi:adenylyltransferase/sulfurtransferase
MNSITVTSLADLIEQNFDLQLIDVREPEEHEAFNIGGELIPLGDITHQLERISTERPVVIYCRKGIRSQLAIQRLQEKLPYKNLINLIGGTEAWKKVFPV